MICDVGLTSCVFYKSKTLRKIAENVNTCKFNGVTGGQFAAVDAFIAHTDMPYIDNRGMMCAPCTDFKACQNVDVSLVSTLISLVSSYKQIRNVIVFDDDDINAKCTVTSVDAVRTKGNAGITCTVSCVSGDSSKYIVNASTMLKPVIVDQPHLLDIVKVLIDTDYSLTWIKSSKCIELATALQTRSTNMWINNTDTATNSINLTGSCGTRVLPMMYTLPTVQNVVSVNFSNPSLDITSRVEDTSMRLNVVVSQIINASTKNQKCYYCSFMENIHDDLCCNTSAIDCTYIFKFSDIVNDILTGQAATAA